VALRLLRASVSGEELPLYYEFENRTTPDLMLEIVRHAQSRDAAFYVAGVVSVALVGCLVRLAVSLRDRWLLRRQYTRQMEAELETVGERAPAAARTSERGVIERGVQGAMSGFNMSKFRRDPAAVKRQNFEDDEEAGENERL
jgi:hypothetical protein